jgi:hypothetical protein
MKDIHFLTAMRLGRKMSVNSRFMPRRRLIIRHQFDMILGVTTLDGEGQTHNQLAAGCPAYFMHLHRQHWISCVVERELYVNIKRLSQGYPKRHAQNAAIMKLDAEMASNRNKERADIYIARPPQHPILRLSPHQHQHAFLLSVVASFRLLANPCSRSHNPPQRLCCVSCGLPASTHLSKSHGQRRNGKPSCCRGNKST